MTMPNIQLVDICLLAEGIYLVPSSSKCILSLLSTDQSQIFSKSLLYVLAQDDELSAYKSKVDLTACGISFT